MVRGSRLRRSHLTMTDLAMAGARHPEVAAERPSKEDE
jgi:hypothetical protein